MSDTAAPWRWAAWTYTDEWRMPQTPQIVVMRCPPVEANDAD